MVKRYYFDASIWIDFYDGRTGYSGEPLSSYAFRLLSVISLKGYKVIITDLLIEELRGQYSEEQVNSLFSFFSQNIQKIEPTKEQRIEASNVSKERSVPFGDTLHAIIARDNKLIMVARDNHFRKLTDISIFYKPEELI